MYKYSLVAIALGVLVVAAIASPVSAPHAAIPTETSIVSPHLLMMQAGDLPVESADAI